jgi:deoxyribodipyrimidine photo-lyase
MPRTALVWLRNDLRLHDNEALDLAQDADRLVAVYVFDPRHFAQTPYGFGKTGGFRTQFVRECVADLRASVRARGGELFVRHGLPHDVLPQLARQTHCDLLVCHDEPMREEADALQSVVQALPPGVDVRRPWGHTLYHIDDLPFELERLPDVFSSFRRSVERRAEVRPARPAPDRLAPPPDGLEPGEIPSLADLGADEEAADPRRALATHGGETRALERLDAYFWHGDHLRRYKETRNGLLGADYSSKFSPWLAHGCLSPRYVYEQVRAYESERTSNKSTYWMVFEMIWRDFFRFYGARWGDRLFYPGGPQGSAQSGWEATDHAFNLWASGQTGIPFVDANMRELRLTGWMSNRGRQNAASFWVKNLGGDWRRGAAWFERMLIDYDVTSNWGNWAYAAGVGADPRADRYFNLVSQAERYDPDAAFVTHWCPELEALPPALAHQPWLLTAAEQQTYAFRPGTDYPLPMIDLEASYEPLRAARRGGRS